MNDTDFERELRASLRYGAAQARIPDQGFDPLTVDSGFEDELRTELRSGADHSLQYAPTVPRRSARRTRWLVEGLAAAAVVAVLAVAIAIVSARRHDQAAGPGPAPSWEVRIGFADGNAGLSYRATDEVSARPGTRLRLEISVAPADPDGKTYLYRAVDNGEWVWVGPHNTDATSKEHLQVSAPAAGQTAAYRVLVMGDRAHSATWSDAIYIHGTQERN